MRAVYILLLSMIMYSSLHAQVTNPRTLPAEWESYGIGDPYILKFRGKYYLYCSTRDDQNGVKCWSSWDLTDWTYEGLCVSNSIAISKGAYAPEVIYWNGMFYMYTSPAGNGHYVLSSASPTGPFTVQTGNLGRVIDGSVLIDDDNAFYFSYAGPAGIQGAAMSSPQNIDGPATNTGAFLNGWTEASTIFKRNGLYYMIYTGNHVFSPGYRVYYATSTAPLGPYTAANNNPIILRSEGSFYGLGHSGSIQGPDLDTWYIAYHNLLGRSPIAGPLRKLNIDPTGFNGSKLVVLGPTNWSQPTPSLPAFYDRFDRALIGTGWENVNGGNWGIYNQELLWQDNNMTVQWYRQITSANAAADYTAEFNLKEMNRGGNDARFGAVFSYVNETTFGSALFSSYNNTLETDIKINGVSIGVQVIAMPAGWDYQKWHAIRVEKSGSIFKIFVDGLLKSTRTAELAVAGKIGVTTYHDHADFGYTAFSNYVNGSGIFDFHKPVPGTLEAVHYNTGGEGSGYHDTSPGNIGGAYRKDQVDIRDCPEGGYNVGWNTTGEWYQYNINVKATGPYHLGLRYATSFTASKVRVWCDNTDVSGVVSLPTTNGWDNWQTFTIKNIDLPAGYHTLRMETIEGEFDFYTMQFVTGTRDIPHGADNFDTTLSVLWNYKNGTWTSSNGTAYIPDFGKMTMGDAGWTDYSVEANVRCPASGSAGLIFRVQNPANGGPNNDSQLGTDFLQGYFAGISTGGIILGKHNYNWTSLSDKSQALQANQWYKIRAVAHGPNVQVYLDNMTTPVITYSDTNPFVSGKAGLRVHGGKAEFDNFLIYDAVGGTTLHTTSDKTDSELWTAPNPFTDECQVYIGAAIKNVSICITDMKGVVVERYTDNVQSGKVRIGKRLPAGVFSVTIGHRESARSFRIIKQ